MRRQARVIALEQNVVHLSIQRAGCERCERGQGCGAGLMARLLTPDEFHISLPRQSWAADTNPMTALAPGDRVWVLGSDQLLLRLALRLYALPCIALMLALMLVHWLMPESAAGWRDFSSVIAGTAALYLTWRWGAPMSQAIPLWHGLRLLPLHVTDGAACGRGDDI